MAVWRVRQRQPRASAGQVQHEAMRRPSRGVELWRLESMHGFNARGAKRTADGDIMSGFQARKHTP